MELPVPQPQATPKSESQEEILGLFSVPKQDAARYPTNGRMPMVRQPIFL